MENDRERKELEIAHQARVAADKSVHEATPDYIIERFRAAKLWRLFPKEFMFKCLKEYEGKKVVDFGCGDGEISTQLASVGAYTTGL